MTHFARKTAGVVRENLVAFRDLSLNTFYLPPGAPLTFQPMRQVERLHIVLEGACTIRPGRNVFKVEKGAAVGIAAPGAHKIEASEQGVALMTAAFRHDDRDAGSGNDGIAIFDLLGLPQGEVAAQLDHWAGRTGVRGRAFFMVHRDTGEGVRVHRRAHRVFVVLRGAISVETPAGATRVQAMEVFPVPPATPHRVVMGAGVTGRVLVFTDSEGAEEVLNHVSCGAAFERCFLADFRGEGQVVLTGDGTVVSANRAAVAWLGLPESPVGARLFDFLPSTDAARLSRHLKQPVGRPPARWRLHLETSPASRVEAVFVPYQGRRRVQKAVLVLRRFQDDGLEHPGGPVRLPRPEQDLEAFLAVSPSMVELSRELRPLALSNRWVVVGGEPGTGRTTVASLLHHMGEHPDGRFVIRDCAAWTPAQVLDAVARPSSGPGGAGSLVTGSSRGPRCCWTIWTSSPPGHGRKSCDA